METFSNNDKILLGRGIGHEILNAVNSSKHSVKIVSPYLSPNYITELVNLSNNGIEVTLITCDNLETDPRYSDFKHSDIIKQEKVYSEELKVKKWFYRKMALISFILTIISILFL